jgi:hypothetical protein
LPFQPASAETQRRLRRVALKLLGEQVRYSTERRALGTAGGSVHTVGVGEVQSVTDQHIIFTSATGEDVVGLGDLRAIDIDDGAGP